MAALKLPVMICMICSCLGVTFPQRYERLHPVITQSLPQTIYQFLNQPQAREFLPELIPNSVPSTSRDTTTTTTIRKKPKSLPTKPKLEPITQASFYPITFPGSQATSSSYSSLDTREFSGPSTVSPLLSTLRPNDIPAHPQKGSLKPDHFQRADQTSGSQSSDHSKGDQSSGGHSRGDQSSGNQSSAGHSRGDQSSGGHSRGDQSSGGHSRRHQSIEGQSITFKSNGDQTSGGQSKGDHGTLFRSEVHPKIQHRLVDNQATSSRAATQQQVLFQASNNHEASFQVPGNHEHSFSIINHGESQGPQDKHDLHHIPDNREETFNFANNQQKFLGSASKHRTSRLTSASRSQISAKKKIESRSNAGQTAQKLHQKRDFGATPKVFFEHPHHQAVFEEPHSRVFHHQHGGDALLHAGGVVGASHHDLSFGGAPHLLGSIGHAGHDHHHRPAKYDFQYVVKDEYGGNDFGHQESRSGHDTKGAYYVQLPDGRRQTVSYFVNKGSGFVAKVHYEGKAVHPQPKHAPHGIQSGTISHIPVHQLETFDHVPKGHNLHNSFAHGGVGETVFSLPTASKFH